MKFREFAGHVLEKASAGQYKIEPVIRHGDPVGIEILSEEKLLPRLEQQLDALKEKGYHTIAVICRTEEEAAELRSALHVREFTQATRHFSRALWCCP